MKGLCTLLLAIVWSFQTIAAEKSTTIVYIDGAKYYIHNVQPGETLFALSKLYGVGEKVIVQNNPTAAQGLRASENLKIPVIAQNTGEQLSEKKLARQFNFHQVTKGETLFAISRQFEIPVNTIIADNPGIDPIHLRLGERILIRRKEVGSEDESGSREQWAAYQQSLNSVAPNGTAYHLVESKETLYALAHRYNTTEEVLSQMNNGLKASELKAGAIIKVPGEAKPENTVAESTETPATSETTQPIDAITEPSVPAIHFQALRPVEPLRIALLLPLAVGSQANSNYLEFYQGFLLGLDSVRTQHGYKIDLDLYNTRRSPDAVREIVADEKFGRSQLIVGPVYEECIKPVVEYAEQKQIPVVSPLANLTEVQSGTIFQMAPDPAFKYAKIANLIAEKAVTLIYTESTDKEFEQEVLSLLGDKAYDRHTYKYVHPSSGKSAANSSGDLTPLLENGKDNLFIVMADKEVDVDRILAAIASANTSISSRGMTPPQFVVFGNARWNRFNNIDRSIFFKDQVVFLSTYHAKRDSEAVVAFDGAYIRAFGSLPTLYSYRGYDAAVIFATALYNDIDYNLEGRTYSPLQTRYRFSQENPGDNHVNNDWTRVNYHSDFTITIE